MKTLLMSAVLTAVIATSCTSGGNEKIVLNSTHPGYEEGMDNAVFFAPGIEGHQRQSYLYFFSKDSVFSKHSGILTGYVLHYENVNDSIKIHFTDKERSYKLLGNQVLMADDRAFFRVSDFNEAFKANTMEVY